MDKRNMFGFVYAVRGLKVRSALNPGLWLVGIGTVPLLVLAIFFKEFPIIMYTLFIVAVFIIICVLGIFLYFSIWHRKTLDIGHDSPRMSCKELQHDANDS